ncbi:MAG: hypothetical protein V4805_16645, partial [Pseudomonadota bacterium]
MKPDSLTGLDAGESLSEDFRMRSLPLAVLLISVLSGASFLAFADNPIAGKTSNKNANAHQPVISSLLLSDDPAPNLTLSQKYKNDVGIGTDPDVMFSSNFENNLAGWSNVSWADPGLSNESELMAVINNPAKANGGSKFLQSKVTKTQLAIKGGSYQYISAQVQHQLATPSDIIYVRFYAQYVGLTETPHHWIRVGAGSTGGQANVKPNGNTSFWFNL